MNDLLSDSFVSDAREHPPRDMDIQMSTRLPRSNSDMGMESFNKQIQDIEKQVDKLSGLLKKLKDSNEESKSVTKASSMKAIRKRMEKDVDEVGKIARNVKTKIEAINKETINNLIETGNSEQIFQNAMKEMGRGQVLNTLEEIQERHDAVKEIEKKLLDLHQIYLDMAVLVEAQGDLLDNIESQVTNAVDHVQSGTTALHTAKKLQKKSRKCMCIAIILLLVIIAIVVVSVIQPWKSGKGA
ncbi:Syntaxin, N-terminal [Cynara cardunculus var. scolymus]|uniref:Syntaxin, N-terminal n=1 Tax=Cynara cardunculus var. scolymus TaxID=59895 RepID=A0A118K2D5_CYNCS|nr:Syntaxin, N-terminal [Cynara cardunculus var. scolymus]